MTLETLISNWTAAQHMARNRFRWLEEDAMRFLRGDMARFAQHLAETHDQTLAEAREEVEALILSVARSQQRQAA